MWVTIGSGAAKGITVRLEGRRFVVGSGPECHLIVPHPSVAALHAYFETRDEDGRVLLHDLGSEGGTLVNGRRIDDPVLLEGDEEIQVGEVLLVPTLEEPPEEAAPAGGAAAAVDAGTRADAEAADAEAGAAAAEERAAAAGPPPAERRRRLRGRLPRLPRGGRARSAAAEERRALRRFARLAIAVGAAAAVLALAALVLALTGVILDEDEGRDPSGELAAAVKRATPATVIVAARGPSSSGQGSGWVLDARAGLVVTNFHVVNGGDNFRIGTPDGSREAELFAAAPCDDLAVLRVRDRSGLRTLPLGTQSDVDEGEQVAALGYPVDASPGDDLISTAGVVSVARDDSVSLGPDAPSLPNAIGTDALVTPGSSGGPLIDSSGRLLGVNTGGLAGNVGGRPVQGQGYAIGVDRVKEVTGILREGRSQGWTGMSLVVVSARERAQRRLPEGLGVTAAVPGSPADEAGLGRRPMMLVAVDGVRVRSSLASYCEVAADSSRGDSAVFSLVGRAGSRPRDVEIEFK